MLRLVPYLAAGLASASAFASSYLDPLVGSAHTPATFEARWAADSVVLGPASGKARQDRLTAPRKSEPQAITTIEVRGLSTAAIVYRDQNGKVLFRNDPATQTTTVAKGVVVPDVMIRSIAPLPAPAAAPISAPRPEPAPLRRDLGREKTERLPDGCESAFSVVAAPSLANITGRCVA